MDSLIVWLNSLEVWQNILVSMSLMLVLALILGCVVALFFKWMDRLDNETQIVHPSEDELRQRKNKEEKDALLKYSMRRKL